MNYDFKKVLMKIRVTLTIAALLISVTPASASAAGNAENQADLALMYQWLTDNQLSNGALPMYGAKDGDTTVVPYFSSIAALGILSDGHMDKTGLDAVRSYCDWYFSHLNDGTKGDAGTIYNYRISIKNKQVVSEISTDEYDSADSYAALFLTVLREYKKSGGDTEYIWDKRDEIYSMINLLVSLIDEDGLCRVSHVNHTTSILWITAKCLWGCTVRTAC